MTENEKDQLIIYIDTDIDKLQKIQDLLKGLKHPEDCPGRLWEYDQTIHIDIHTMEDLHRARAFLRYEFGTWEDKLTTIFASYNAYAVWEGRARDVEIRIYLSCPVDEFPERLQKDGCGFKKITREALAYVCSKEGA